MGRDKHLEAAIDDYLEIKRLMRDDVDIPQSVDLCAALLVLAMRIEAVENTLVSSLPMAGKGD
jgi:hypothetical protein